MNDFEGLIPTDLGFKPQGKSAPMAGSKSSSSSNLGSSRPRSSASNSFDDRDSLFTSTGPHHRSQDFGSGFGDLFGSARYATKSESAVGGSLNFDTFPDSGVAKPSAAPVYDKPVYDDDIFDGVPGLKSSTSKTKYEDIFESVSATSPKGSDAFDDLLGGIGKLGRESKASGLKGSDREQKGVPLGFDDLIPGFGVASATTGRTTSEASWSSEPPVNAARSTSNAMEDPFKVLESTSRPVVSSPEHIVDPLEQISKLNNSRSTKNEGLSTANGGVSDDMDPFNSLGKSVPAFSSEGNNRVRDKSRIGTDASTSWNRTSSSKDPIEKTSMRSPENHSEKKVPVERDQESHQPLFDMPAFSTDSHISFGQTASPPAYGNSYATLNESNVQMDMSPRSEEKFESSDDVWLTVSEIPLFTQPTSAPPPSRPPPPRPVQVSNSKGGSGSPAYGNSRKKVNEYSSFPTSTRYFQSPNAAPAAGRDSVASPLDELEDFAMGRSQNNVDEHAEGLSSEELAMNSAAAAMKDAMERAEAKFRHAREVRERESTKAARSRDAVQLEKDERTVQDERALREKQERSDRERLQREREEEEKEQKRLEKERERAREMEREREEKEKEQRRLDKEREKARQAVERATREARERAAADARSRAEKAAVEKVNAEARERAERAAVQRAQAEARERAAADAKERAEKAAAEARERTNAEAKDRAAAARAEAEARVRAAERAAVERAASEARERAAAGARERAAAAARMNQQKNEEDLESFFGVGSRASSAPRPRANSSDPAFDSQFQNRQEPEARKSASTSSNIRKANSTTNIVDDLSSIFGAPPSSGEFQEVEGESEERRRARLERQQRAHERATKALAEKNNRDLQTQREQAERHRIGETLDVEIKRWSAGKEGNLRALLSTLQYVLWPECGWQPVSLTDLITGVSVKKVYRKATLCIHPDKVQQKGATLQQKYVAEKVFDLLKVWLV
ncbi:Auxilin-related protein 2 [Morella rubra]|uniref:Auxilin-related protein 2 n=1 Tax=Morella rubra TaxID=262757 RepID=A0A6A1VCN0_9ROSI|nr:Auxilin-related protein 2 [Morella rubra]